jgi:cation diffusion facilitator family transporter
MAAGSSSKRVIYAALIGNLMIALTKFGAAAWTGSSAMLSEAVHSLVDTGNQTLMLYGLRRAARPPDDEHPLGHGRELYFWSFVVALLIFSLGAGVSFYEGVNHVRHPVAIVNPNVNYIVLGLAFLFEGATWWIAFREFDRRRGKLSYLQAATRSRDPTSFLVLFEDSAALLGIVIAFTGTFAAERLSLPVLDGIASIGIGMVLATTAVFLARECKGLLIGEPAREDTRQSICRIAGQLPGITGVGRLITVHLGPHQIVAVLDVDFSPSQSAGELQHTVGRLQQLVKEKHSDISEIFVSPKAARNQAHAIQGSAPGSADDHSAS